MGVGYKMKLTKSNVNIVIHQSRMSNNYLVGGIFVQLILIHGNNIQCIEQNWNKWIMTNNLVWFSYNMALEHLEYDAWLHIYYMEKSGLYIIKYFLSLCKNIRMSNNNRILIIREAITFNV